MKKKIKKLNSNSSSNNDVLLAIKQLDDKLSSKLDLAAKRSDNNLNLLEKRFGKELADAIKFLKNEIDSAFDAVIFKTDEKFEAIDQKIDDLTKKVDFLPTKDEYYKSMDKLIGEVQDERDENVLIEHRMERIEKHFPQMV